MNYTAQQTPGQMEPIVSRQVVPHSEHPAPPQPSPVIVAGTSDGLVLLDPEPSIELDGKSITALAVHSDGLWAIVDRYSIWHRSGSRQWNPITSVDSLQLNCLLPVADTVLVGTSEAHLLRVTDGRIDRVESFDQIEERKQWYTPWGGPPDVRSMAVSPVGDIYVNVHVGGILRSSDQGQSWQSTINFHADVHEVRTVREAPDLVLAATAEGLAISHDRGKSWSFDRTNLHATYARAVAVCENIVLMTASTGPHGNKAALYRRWLDQPDCFAKCTVGLPEWFSDNINTGTLATAGKVAVFGTREGQIFRSEDAGLTWKQVAANLAPITCLNFDRI